MARPDVSIATELLYATLYPQTVEDEENDWHLLKFCDALCSKYLEEVRYLVADRDEHPGWSIVFNVDDTPAYILPYLAQFIGVRLTPDLTEEQIREKIRSTDGFRRGTPAAILAAARLYLTGTKVVTMTERHGFGVDHPYRLFIRVYNAQTPDCDKVLEAILEQKPAGIRLDFACVDGQTYDQLAADFPPPDDYNDVLAAFDDYDDAYSTLP